MKPDITLLLPEFLEGMAEVMGQALEKYERDGWKLKGVEYTRERIASAYRHLLDLHKGIDVDEESKLHPALHLGCNAMIIYYLMEKYEGPNNSYELELEVDNLLEFFKEAPDFQEGVEEEKSKYGVSWENLRPDLLTDEELKEKLADGSIMKYMREHSRPEEKSNGN